MPPVSAGRLPRVLRAAAAPARRSLSTTLSARADGVTQYTLHADGKVEHAVKGTRLDVPLTREQAGEQTHLTAAGVDAYLTRKLAAPDFAADPALARGLARADEAGLPRIAVTAQLGQFLAVLTKAVRAERVLEIGTLGGYSTAFFAKALPRTGQIDTIEYSPAHARVAQANFLDLDLFPFPTVHVGPALDLLRDPAGVFARPPGELDPGYDLVFVDANKDEYFEYFVEALRLTKSGGVIVFDNAIRGGRIAVPDGAEVASDATGLRKIFDWIEEDAGKTVLSAAIQTVGDKSWDGFAIVYKN
ncbi:hypothetical protein Q8F55_007490 [Vanrija albida]|uniref:O-methyltransferase n=1 Tax=Vanrija albida TaxID=181172 RepID=A0ABR3PTW9_9TREE